MFRSVRHPFTSFLVVLTVGSLVALSSPHIAAADDGCGTGTNGSVKTRDAERIPFGRRVITIPAAYTISADTCNATATATRIREEVNRISRDQKRVETVATLGTLIGWLISPAGAAAVGGSGFILSNDIESAKVRLNSIANAIQEASQRCGNRGIVYSAGINPAGRTLYASNFACQVSNNKDLDPDFPDISDLSPPTSDLVPGPEPDGGTPCSDDQNNLYFSHNDALDQYWMDTFESSSGNSFTFRRYQWNESTGDYDLDQGTFTQECGPAPSSTVTVSVTTSSTFDSCGPFDCPGLYRSDEVTYEISTLSVPEGTTPTLETPFSSFGRRDYDGTYEPSLSCNEVYVWNASVHDGYRQAVVVFRAADGSEVQRITLPGEWRSGTESYSGSDCGYGDAYVTSTWSADFTLAISAP